MHFRSIAAIALPLLGLTAQALPVAMVVRDDLSFVENSGLGQAEKSAKGLGAALGSSGSSSNKQSNSNGGSSSKSNGNSNNNNGGNNNKSGKNNNGASKSQSAAKAARTRPCDEGDQSLQAGLQALITVHLGAQSTVTTLTEVVQKKNVNAADVTSFAANQKRLQQFLQTADLQLKMTDAIADDDSFAQPQLASLKKSTAAALSITNGLKNQASDVNTLKKLGQTLRTATGVVQDGVNNAVVDCFLPTNLVSG